MTAATDPGRPLLLVSNDDGYQAPGVLALAARLESVGEVWVVAPERERSAISHAISLHKPLRLGNPAPRRYWCSGTPTDSVYIAMHHVLPRLPAMVVSGVNRGANLGDDVLYSGTVGAAMEGCVMGIPSLAVSLAHPHGTDFWPASELAARVVKRVLRTGLPKGVLLNLNVPNEYDVSRGIVPTRLGRRNYGRVVSRHLDPRGKPYYWIGGPDLGFEPVDGSDCDGIHAGRATLSPVHLDLTHEATLRQLLDADDYGAPLEEPHGS